jgi:hypothetical protein
MDCSSAKAGDQPPPHCIALTTTMDKKARLKHQIPSGGTWYKILAPMLEEYEAGGRQGFTVTWDIIPTPASPNTKPGAKAFGLYASAEAFHSSLMSCKKDCRYACELIPEGKLCKAYADIEWCGQPDSNHTILKKILAYIRQCASTLYPEKKEDEWEIHVACGSRDLPDSGLTKNSYHATFTNLLFDSNKDMKELFNVPDYLNEFFWMNKKGKPTCMIDQLVYGKNRCIRTPYSVKRYSKGAVPPLLRLKNVDEVCYQCCVSMGVARVGH